MSRAHSSAAAASANRGDAAFYLLDGSPGCSAAPGADISFVCCVESGGLEAQAVRMVASLRRFGGAYKNAPVFAVTPRRGPALSVATRASFDALAVTHLPVRPGTRYTWFNFLNKPLALVAAQPHIATPIAAWLDSDLLFTGEPSALGLAADEDFLAFPVECKEMGTTGPGDPYESFWQACGQASGVDVNALPWVTAAETAERVRLYFNGGVFVYRHAGGFAEEYLATCLRLLDARFITDAPGFALGVKEMISIGLAAIKLGLRWRALPYTHNYVMSGGTHRHWYRRENLAAARIVHYHDSMWPPFWPTFLGCLRDTHPEVADWLAPLGPMSNEAAPAARLVARVLRSLRRSQSERYHSSCAVV